MFKFITLLCTTITLNSLACDNTELTKKNFETNKLSIWLGGNSQFSKTFIKSKCVLEEQLQGMSLSKKRLIVKLISQSYTLESEDKESYSF